jgi:methyl-accepting chemotaxis protein
MTQTSNKLPNSNLSALPPISNQTELKPRDKKSFSLRNLLLSTVLPTVLGTLAISSFLGYRIINNKAVAQTKQKLEKELILAGKTIDQLLAQAIKIPELVAQDTFVLSSLNTSQQQVASSNLDQLSIDQLEAKFANTKLLKPNQELNNYLKGIVKVAGLEEVFYTDRNGFNIAYSNPTSDFVQRDETWWQNAKNQTQWLSPPEFDESANTVGFELVQAISNPNSGEFIGVIKALLPGNYFDVVADNLSYAGIANSQAVQIMAVGQDKAFQTITVQGLSENHDLIGGIDIAPIAELIYRERNNPTKIENELQKRSLQQINIVTNQAETKMLTASFAAGQKYYTIFPIDGRDWVAIASINVAELNSAASAWSRILLFNGLGVGIVGAIIIFLVANQVSSPLVSLATTAEKVAQGELNLQAQSVGTLEIKTLANSFNNLLFQVKQLLNQKQEEAAQANALKKITLEISQLSKFDAIVETAIRESHAALQVDRLIYYQFDDNWQGKIVAESVLPNFPAAKGAEIYDPCFAEGYIAKYQQGRVGVVNDIEKANLTECHLGQLKPFQVKANVVVPVIVKDKLDGLLIAHQCSAPRDWQPNEVEFLTQVANQIGFALNRLTFIQQQQLSQEKEKQAKEAIQNRALDLLKEVYDVGEGNLTIRARVTEDEIGTIADSYNSTIESLQKLVNQVKSAVQEVKVTTGTNEQAVEELAQEAIAQSEEIGITLCQVLAMNESIKSVSFNAAKAQDVVKLATASIASGDNAMNQTVVEIDAIQTIVTEAANKIKQLGSSSAEISQAVELISRFAAQTHLLALKASIEAARAGEQGKGFAVIADEVRSLATQSAAATAEIDNLVTRIQLETNEVVEVMKMGTQQVAAGTKQVEQTRQNLNEVTVASQEISNLVEKIASAALLQSETSEQVNQTMTKVAAIAEENSQSATQVAQAIKQLSAVAETLQKGIGKFKT